MYTAGLCILLSLALSPLVSSRPVRITDGLGIAGVGQTRSKRGVTLPIQRRTTNRNVEELLVGTIGLGDFADTVYTVAIKIGNTTTAVNLDTGSSDLWVKSTDCESSICQQSTSTAYSPSALHPTGASVNLTFGDATSGTFAAGPVDLDNVTLAGLSLPNQPLAAVNSTDNSAVSNGSAGIIGLGFPAESSVQTHVIAAKFNDPSTTDDFVSNIGTYGPFVSRLVESGVIDQPLFAITLQRDTIDVSGTGQISIGELPAGIDNSSMTWVPVRLYTSAEGGLSAPTFASTEVYPLRWEVPIENVYLDGKQLANSTIPPNGVSPSFTSALIDTGNSLIRGPKDVTNNILSTVSPAFGADSSAKPTLPCTDAHTLAFQIGGKMFSVDPRDFITQNQTGDAAECVASSVVSTDPPSFSSLFSWSLGDPFLKSNLVAFYYGNLTNPSVDPPRIGFMSMVPDNASVLLDNAVASASRDGGVFQSAVDAAPTASTLLDIAVTPTPSPPAPFHSMTAIPLDRQSNAPSSSAASPRYRPSCRLFLGMSLLSLYIYLVV